MQHWSGRDARQHGPWLGAATVLHLLRTEALPRLAALVARVPDPRPTVGQVRWLGGTVAATLVLGVVSTAFVAGSTAPAPTPPLASDALGHLRVALPERDDHDVDDGSASPDAAGGTEVAGATLGAPETGEPSPPTVELPTGKGMWFHKLEQAQASPEEIVAHARAAGLTHVYVRTGSSKMGFYAQGDLDRILPAAHAAGLKVVGWDFPYLDDPVADAGRALAAISYSTPDGHRIDAFSADIETPSEGVNLGRERVEQYVQALRYAAGPGYPLIGTVPNACLNESFPYREVAQAFDALAPMVYWITRDPAADVACNIEKLAGFGIPVLPVGQAYDPAIDNPVLTDLVPTYDDLASFLTEAERRDVPGVSFWAWHTATPEMWQAIADARGFGAASVAAEAAT